MNCPHCNKKIEQKSLMEMVKKSAKSNTSPSGEDELIIEDIANIECVDQNEGIKCTNVKTTE